MVVAVPYVRSEISSNSALTLRSEDVSIGKFNVLARFVLWDKALENFTESPIVGVGVTRYDDEATVISTLQVEDKPIYEVEVAPTYFERRFLRVNVGASQAHTDQSAHNMYLQTLAEGGIMLLVLLVVLISSTIRRLDLVVRQEFGVRKGLAQGIVYAIYAVLVAAFFGNSYLNVIPMFFPVRIGGLPEQHNDGDITMVVRGMTKHD